MNWQRLNFVGLWIQSKHPWKGIKKEDEVELTKEEWLALPEGTRLKVIERENRRSAGGWSLFFWIFLVLAIAVVVLHL